MPVKILHIISSLRRGGKERQLSIITVNTDPQKYPSLICYFNDSDENYINEYALDKYLIKIKSTGFLVRLYELHKTIRRINPDIIFTWGILESFLILLLKPVNNFKFINGSLRHGIRSKKLYHYFRTVILHFSEYIVANSYAGLKANNIKRGYILHNGIDSEFIGTTRRNNRISKRKQFIGLKHNQVLLISVANMVPYKDYLSILIALKRLKDEGYEFHYLILGDGPLKTIIKEKILEYNLLEEITVLGNVENVNEFLKSADIFIHSSKGEGCSNAILEAMASGLTVIATDTGGTPEIVTDDNGFLFNYKDHEKLFNLVKYCLDNFDECENIGIRSYELIKNKFTVEKMIHNYYQILEKVIADE